MAMILMHHPRRERRLPGRRTTLRAAIHSYRTPIGVTAIVLSLWALAFLASSDTWREEVPRVRAVGMRAPISAVATPIVYRTSRRHASGSSSADPIPVARKKNAIPHAGIVKRGSVQLTANQSRFVKSFGAYLKSVGEGALVTSGTRTAQHQLAIIKSKIRALGASRKFPSLARARVDKPSTWLAAWQYLRDRRVPVYAPANAAGVGGETSNHLKGLAVDLISGSLDRLTSLVHNFKWSQFAMSSPLKVTTVAREAGCVHINLAP